MNQPATDFVDVSTRTLAGAPEETIYEVQLSRPEKRNALPMETVAALADCFESVEPADGRAIVVTAAGADFSLGADLADLDPESFADPAELAIPLQDLVGALRACPLPVVAGVQGRAYGAGFLLCLGADFVVASDEATFGLPEVDLGIPVAGFATTLLPRLVGERTARRWLLTGSDVDAETAADAGFVTETAPANSLQSALDELLGDLVDGSPTAIAALKTRLAPIEPPSREDARADEQNAMRAAYEDGDATERIDRLR
jgi:enoyl-CoA hydratase/carnithine racemase